MAKRQNNYMSILADKINAVTIHRLTRVQNIAGKAIGI
jgi:hypothetical protein